MWVGDVEKLVHECPKSCHNVDSPKEANSALGKGRWSVRCYRPNCTVFHNMECVSSSGNQLWAHCPVLTFLLSLCLSEKLTFSFTAPQECYVRILPL